MGKRGRKRAGTDRLAGVLHATTTSIYSDDEGNVLELRDGLSRGSIKKIQNVHGSAAATTEDDWHRRQELLFERLALRWTISGLLYEEQKELIGRFRMASHEERTWVTETMTAHVRKFMPKLEG